MTKTFKVFLAILLTLVTAALILFFTLGGLPAKRKAEQISELISKRAADYPYADEKLSGETVIIEEEGLLLHTPAGTHPKDSSDLDSIRAHLYVSDYDKKMSLLVPSAFDFGEFNLGAEEHKVSRESLNYFAKSIGFSYNEPWDWHQFYELLYHMDIDDCNIHSFRQANTFYALALIKNEMIQSYWDTWDWKTDCGEGFITVMMTPEDDPKNPRYKVLGSLYMSDSPNVSHDIMLSAKDLETCCAILNSVEPAE